MPLHQYFAARLHLLDAIREEDVRAGTVVDSPIAMENLAQWADDGSLWEMPEGVGFSDESIPGPNGAIRVRVYRPGVARGPALLWVHGGGFTAGTIEDAETHVVSAELAARAGCIVVAVDYRLATSGSLYPVPLDDVRTAWAWMCDQKFASRTVVGGASAGAALAFATSVLSSVRPDAVLLAYPFVHYPVPALDDAIAAEMIAFPAILRFTPHSVESMVRSYVGRISDVPLPALPGHLPLSADLPPTWIVVAEYDDLRPSGEMLTRQLDEAGASVSLTVEKGVLHGHLSRLPHVPGVSASLDWMALQLQSLGGAN